MQRDPLRDILVVPSAVVEMVYQAGAIQEFGHLVELRGTWLLTADFKDQDVKVHGIDVVEVHTPGVIVCVILRRGWDEDTVLLYEEAPMHPARDKHRKEEDRQQSRRGSGVR
jgi:hypothetical protein